MVWGLIVLTLVIGCYSLKKYELRVGHRYMTPDCVDRVVITINDQFPGPEIRALPGEKVRIKVINNMNYESLSIHWHGMHMMGSPWMDGAAMASQCPIPPKSSFIYEFNVNNRPGTYFYHGHSGGIRTKGIMGAFIIEEDIDTNEEDIDTNEKIDQKYTMLMTDWYHEDIESIVQGLLEPTFRWPDDPETILINGVGQFDCFDNEIYSCNNENVCREKNSSHVINGATSRNWYVPYAHKIKCDESYCSSLPEFKVKTGKKYIFRLINAGSLSLLNIAIEKHQLTIIEADGEPTAPLNVSSIDINVGQRISVLLTASELSGIFVIRVKTRSRPGVRSANAFLVYNDGNTAGYDVKNAFIQQPPWDDNEFTFTQQNSIRGDGTFAIPKNNVVAKRFIFLGTQERFNISCRSYTNGIPSVTNITTSIGTGNNRPEKHCDSHNDTLNLMWATGRRIYQTPETPALAALYFNLSGEILIEEKGYYLIKKKQVYDVVLQNYPACNGVCETHSWHLHGHHFWVLGTFRGEWNGSQEQINQLNVVDPPYRDTVMTVSEGVGNVPFPDGEHLGGCGYTVVRFIADNPGFWNMHCHQTWHLVMGMNAAFYTNNNEIPPPPEDLLMCGNMRFRDIHQEKNNISFPYKTVYILCISFFIVILIFILFQYVYKPSKKCNRFNYENVKTDETSNSESVDIKKSPEPRFIDAEHSYATFKGLRPKAIKV